MIGTAGESCQIRRGGESTESFASVISLAQLYILFWLTSRADRWVAGCLVPLALWVLLNGLDDIGQTLQHAPNIDAYEAARRREQSWLPSTVG